MILILPASSIQSFYGLLSSKLMRELVFINCEIRAYPSLKDFMYLYHDLDTVIDANYRANH